MIGSYMMKTHYFMAISAVILFGVSACDRGSPDSLGSNPPATDSALADPSPEPAMQNMRDEASNAITNMADAAADEVEDAIGNIQENVMDGSSDAANGVMQDLMDGTVSSAGEAPDGAAQNMMDGTTKKAADVGNAALEGLIKDRVEDGDEGVLKGMMEK